MTLSASEHSKVEALLEEEQHYQHAARRKTNQWKCQQMFEWNVNKKE